MPGLVTTDAGLKSFATEAGSPVLHSGAPEGANYFFFGDDRPDWQHRHECIRVTYSMDEAVVRDGLRIIAEEVRRCQG